MRGTRDDLTECTRRSCGHIREMHEHFGGADLVCYLCGCRRFRPPAWRRLAGRLPLVLVALAVLALLMWALTVVVAPQSTLTCYGTSNPTASVISVRPGR
jgi:hypothetical protein